MKDISVQLELKYIHAQNLKKKTNSLRRSRFVLDRTRLTGCSWFSGGRHNVPSLSLVSAFSLYCFTELAFLLDLAASYFFRRNHYSTLLDCDCKTACEFKGLLLFRALGVSEA